MPFQAWIRGQPDHAAGWYPSASMGPCPFRHGYSESDVRLACGMDASMGPCPFRHGYKCCGPKDSSTTSGFNGAMPFQAWIRLPSPPVFSPRPRLQWGHALSGMDTRRRPAGWLAPSMLQWGHALSGMDTSAPEGCLPSDIGLQWGHALSGMDTLYVRSAVRPQSACFNGAMPFQAWIPAVAL